MRDAESDILAREHGRLVGDQGGDFRRSSAVAGDLNGPSRRDDGRVDEPYHLTRHSSGVARRAGGVAEGSGGLSRVACLCAGDATRVTREGHRVVAVAIGRFCHRSGCAHDEDTAFGELRRVAPSWSGGGRRRDRRAQDSNARARRRRDVADGSMVLDGGRDGRTRHRVAPSGPAHLLQRASRLLHGTRRGMAWRLRALARGVHRAVVTMSGVVAAPFALLARQLPVHRGPTRLAPGPSRRVPRTSGVGATLARQSHRAPRDARPSSARRARTHRARAPPIGGAIDRRGVSPVTARGIPFPFTAFTLRFHRKRAFTGDPLYEKEPCTHPAGVDAHP